MTATAMAMAAMATTTAAISKQISKRQHLKIVKVVLKS
jgi:hypothetical protein